MATFRIAETTWNNTRILYIVTSSAILNNKQTERIFETYQKDGTVVFISLEDKGMYLHHHNGDLLTSFLNAVDVYRLKFGEPQTI
jgi:hypothetical protein